MEQGQAQFKDYFLGKLSAEEIDSVELQILENPEFAENMEIAETNLIEEYLDGELAINDQKLFEENYLTCEPRLKKVEFLKSVKKFAKSQSTTINETMPSFFETLKNKFNLRPLTLAFGTIALICAVGITSYFVWKNSTNKSETLLALNDYQKQKNERPLDSRISDFDYAPKVEGTRGTNDKANDDLDLVELSARTTVKQNPTAENLHALGQVYLTKKDFDKATEQFEKAIKQNPNISKLHNDLGVALLEKGKLTKSKCEEKQECEDEKEPYLLSFGKATKEFAKAIELDKTSLEANFNQALCVQVQELPNQSKEAWQNYLNLDSTSKWADEARKNLETIETQKPISKSKEEILKEFLVAKDADDDEKAWEILSRNRALGSGKLIPQQLAFLFVDSKVINNESEAKEVLDGLIYAGEIEEEKSGDFFWRDLAKYYKTVSNKEILELKLAKDRYFETVLSEKATIKNADYKKSISELQVAQKYYIQANNNLESKLIDFLIGYLLNRDIKIVESRKKLEELAKYSQKTKYKWLETQAATWIAANNISETKLSEAQINTKRALSLSNETSDLISQQKNFSQMAEVFFLVGQFEKAFSNIQENLELGKLPEASFPERWRVLNAISRYFYKLKNFDAALVFGKESLAFAKELRDKTFEFTSSVDLGVTYSALGDFENALKLIENGRDIAETFSDGDYKNKCVAHVNLQSGNLKRQKGLYLEAIEHYQNAANYYDSGDFKVVSYDAHRGILQSSLLEKNDNKFEAEFPSIINIFKNYRKQIKEEQNRNIFFDNEQDVYDIVVDYKFRKADFATAFDYSEESRSRSLFDLQHSDIQVSNDEKLIEIKFSENLSEPLKLSQIQAEMPENVQLLEYSVLQDKVLIWSVTKDSFNTEKTDISAENLQEKVLNYRDLVSKKNTNINEQLALSKELYQILITPIKDKLDITKEIFIIPDKSLNKLSFATLFSDKYLIEEFHISYSPSANVFLYCSKKAKEFAIQKPETMLSVGNPAFNQSEYEYKLERLPSAKVEAEEVAKLYQTKPITENNATKQNVKEGLKNVEVFHFAGHYLVDERSPLLSNFVLAGDRKSNLSNYEIIGEKLSHIRLIVLSACDTGIEKFYNGEGMIGASRTFLATGIPTVVASQWSVDSEANKKLMIRFHKLRKIEKLSTSEALRQSQLSMLRDEKFNQPYYWAAFAAIGGYTEF
jgi:CHAT domain-containing protein